jgi:hypothetical protein
MQWSGGSIRRLLEANSDPTLDPERLRLPSSASRSAREVAAARQLIAAHRLARFYPSAA